MDGFHSKKLAFEIKRQYLNNYTLYHNDRHTVGKVFLLRIQSQKYNVKPSQTRELHCPEWRKSRVVNPKRKPIVLGLWSSYEDRRRQDWPAITYIWMGRRAHAVHCTWRVAQNVQTSLLVHGKKIRLDFLHSAYITDDTLSQNYRRALPNSKNSDFPNISIGAHTLLGCEIAETSHDAVRTATSTSDGPAQK